MAEQTMVDPTVPPPDGIDIGRPSVARMYDYYLGGKDNYEVDRAAADKMMSAVPESVQMVRSNRAFLVRAVNHLATHAGVRQFIDIGSGLPTQYNVHEVAQAAAPGSHVVYVDHDPLAVTHGQSLLATSHDCAYIAGDLRRPQEILDHPEVRRLIDFDEPVAILIVAILHFIGDDDDPQGLVRSLRDRMAPGSHLVVSHILDDPRPHAIGRILSAAGAPPWFPRTRSEIMRFFAGFDLIEPGLVLLPQWRPSAAPSEVPSLHTARQAQEELQWQVAGVGRKA